MSGQKNSARKARRTLSSLVLVSGAMVMVVAGAQPAAALDCDNAPPPAPTAVKVLDYRISLGQQLKVVSPGLLAHAKGTGITIETDTSPAATDGGFPSDNASGFGNAAITYPNHAGAFTYTPNPAGPWTGVDFFDYTVVDVCEQEAYGEVDVTVVPVVVGSTYSTLKNVSLTVPVGSGFLAHDKGVDASFLDYPDTSLRGGVIDNSASDGSFSYTPPVGFTGADSFVYSIWDIDGDIQYHATVNLLVGGVPSAPTGVVAKALGNSAIVNWKAPAANGSPIKNYTVVTSPGGKKVTGPSQPLTIKGLAKGVKYTFQVSARNSNGLGPESAPSNAITIVSAQSVGGTGYWMLASNAQVYPFGAARRFGRQGTSRVAIAPRRDGGGYWTVDATGTVSHFGAARGFGENPPLRAGEVVSTISATPSGNGYWLFTNRGRAFAYGDAKFKGDLTGSVLNGPIVASVATPTGNGYFMVGSDGGVFSFGDARFHGSTGGIHLNRPIVGISPTASNSGYWLVASDGGVFAFNAPFRGSMGGAQLSRPVNGLVAYGNGYLMVASDGGVFDFSNTPFLGSLASNPPPAPIIGIAAFTTA